MGLNKQFLDLKQKEKLLIKAAAILRVNEVDLPRVVARFLKEIEDMSKS